MNTHLANRNDARPCRSALRVQGMKWLAILAGVLLGLFVAPSAMASEAELKVPKLGSQEFLGIPGDTLLMIGLGVCALGLAFGMVIYTQLKNLPVHARMREISEL